MYNSTSISKPILMLVLLSLFPTILSAEEQDSKAVETHSYYEPVDYEKRMNNIDQGMIDIAHTLEHITADKTIITQQAQLLEQKGINSLAEEELGELLTLKNKFSTLSKQEANAMGEKTVLMQQKTALMKQKMDHVHYSMKQQLDSLSDKILEQSM